jgi:hypothetical protein
LTPMRRDDTLTNRGAGAARGRRAPRADARYTLQNDRR